MDIREKIRAEIKNQMGSFVTTINDEDSLTEDLDMDSLDNMEFVMGLEEVFDLDIPDNDAEKLNTVLEVYEYIEGRLR